MPYTPVHGVIEDIRTNFRLTTTFSPAPSRVNCVRTSFSEIYGGSFGRGLTVSASLQLPVRFLCGS